MTNLRVTPMPSEHAQAYWNGGLDAHGLKPERHISDGSGVPCRHCLGAVSAGEPYLILAYCPFTARQPYAEVGPVFLHATPCDAYDGKDAIPEFYLNGEARILRAYDRDERIIYGTGRVVGARDIPAYAGELLSDPTTAYVHVRSSSNNCFAFRIDRTRPEA